MQDDGLISIDVDVITSAVILVYERDAHYTFAEITDYVDDMCQGNSQSILIYEGELLVSHLECVHGKWIEVTRRKVLH